MTLRVATVLSARDWESALAARARETAEIRLVLRAYRPEEIERQADRIDVVVAGAEITWVTPARIGVWRRKGLRVVGVHPAGDHPARQRLASAQADEIVPDDLPTPALLRTVCLQRLSPRRRPPIGRRTKVVAVTGPRGAPGRTEVALALAWHWSGARRTLLVDLDLEAPGIAIRLGCPPRPDLVDASDGVHATGTIPEQAFQHCNGLALVVGSHRPGGAAPDRTSESDLVTAARAASELVVVDAGLRSGGDELLREADRVVLVADASPAGLIRAARLTDEWEGPPPDLVLNRVRRRDAAAAVLAARRGTGLDPISLVPDRLSTAMASRTARAPDRALRRALSGLRPPQ